MLFDEYSGNLLAISSIKEEKIVPKKKGRILEDKPEKIEGGGKKKGKKMIVCDTELTE